MGESKSYRNMCITERTKNGKHIITSAVMQRVKDSIYISKDLKAKECNVLASKYIIDKTSKAMLSLYKFFIMVVRAL